MVGSFLICCGCRTCWQVALPSKASSVTCSHETLYLAKLSCTRVLLYAKMLKETEIEEIGRFCHLFLIGDISIRGSPGPVGPPLAMPMVH